MPTTIDPAVVSKTFQTSAVLSSDTSLVRWAASQAGDLQLPRASDNPLQMITIKQTGSGQLTVHCFANEFIDSQKSFVYSTQYESHTFSSDGQQWWLH